MFKNEFDQQHIDLPKIILAAVVPTDETTVGEFINNLIPTANYVYEDDNEYNEDDEEDDKDDTQDDASRLWIRTEPAGNHALPRIFRTVPASSKGTNWNLLEVSQKRAEKSENIWFGILVPAGSGSDFSIWDMVLFTFSFTRALNNFQRAHIYGAIIAFSVLKSSQIRSNLQCHIRRTADPNTIFVTDEEFCVSFNSQSAFLSFQAISINDTFSLLLSSIYSLSKYMIECVLCDEILSEQMPGSLLAAASLLLSLKLTDQLDKSQIMKRFYRH
ncbi:hypothetical protein I4U23_000305 [Adineta vaga]|nr:hypothetical protein I4U23_000305 [Adineta vaga]